MISTKVVQSIQDKESLRTQYPDQLPDLNKWHQNQLRMESYFVRVVLKVVHRSFPLDLQRLPDKLRNQYPKPRLVHNKLLLSLDQFPSLLQLRRNLFLSPLQPKRDLFLSKRLPKQGLFLNLWQQSTALIMGELSHPTL